MSLLARTLHLVRARVRRYRLSMRILLIAYDFPPTQSPRSLRWYYLTRELAMLGHDVHVLTPRLGPIGVDITWGSVRITVHQSFPGPFGWLESLARRKGRSSLAGGTPRAGATRLNWRGQAMDAMKRTVGRALFPDVRSEWELWARRDLRRLLTDLDPDIIVSSHEPATTLRIGLYAESLGFTWVADLGDPVAAAYTPPHWREQAWALEAQVCCRADCVIVTNHATQELLSTRHGSQGLSCSVLPNGYDDRYLPSEPGAISFDDERLELVYAGRLYGYRDPAPLLGAVARASNVRLTLILPDPPPSPHALWESAGASGISRVRVLGALPHAEVRALLERADVLVNFGDRGQPVRTPAKIFEYLGIERPILYVDTLGADASAELLRELKRGWICADEEDGLAALLGELSERKEKGTLHEGLNLDVVSRYAYSSLARDLEKILCSALLTPKAGPARANGRVGTSSRKQ